LRNLPLETKLTVDAHTRESQRGADQTSVSRPPAGKKLLLGEFVATNGWFALSVTILTRFWIKRLAFMTSAA
jgi:hypothetical protein